MSASDQISQTFQTSLTSAPVETAPYRHWILRNVLPEGVRESVLGLPVAPPQVGDIQGRRETINSVRTFFSRENCDEFDVCRNVAAAFQSEQTVSLIERVCNVDLDGSFLRIEYALDSEGFWLEPHTDIGAKLFTLLLYLNDSAPGESWGTDVFNDDREFVKSTPFQPNVAMIFVPSAHTWHGFRRRPITGVRRSLIINYVIPEWRSRHELSFPDGPVRSRRAAARRRAA